MNLISRMKTYCSNNKFLEQLRFIDFKTTIHGDQELTLSLNTNLLENATKKDLMTINLKDINLPIEYSSNALFNLERIKYDTERDYTISYSPIAYRMRSIHCTLTYKRSYYESN